MPDRPNVLFLLSDEHSVRCFGHREEGGEPVHTPTFDDLAANAATFENTYTAMPLCTPSRLCLLTGREVRGAGAWTNRMHLQPDLPTVADSLSAAGYETCLLGKMHLGGNRQFAGFDHRPYGDLTGGTGHQYDPPTPDMSRGMAMRSRTADAGRTRIPESHLQERNVLEETLAWLREHDHRSDEPWFLTASFSRPHFPLTAPSRHLDRYWPDGVTEPPVGYEGDTTDHPMTLGAREGFRVDEIGDEERRRARAAYFACVSFLDEIIGDLLAALEREGFLEDTVVVYTSDHGELAGEHGLWWKHTWHEAAARVPLLVQTPGHRSGERESAEIGTPVSLLDLYPTLCSLVGADVPGDLDGADLSGAVRTGDEPDRGPVVCDNLTPRWGEGTEFRMVREGGYKYVAFRDAPELLFDLGADSLEQENLAPGAEGADAEALERLRGFVDDTMDFEAAEAERERDERDLRENHRLGAPEGSGNAYLMADGRVVDADAPLYRPHVLIEDPGAAFGDWPADDDPDPPSAT
ncbi:MAG: sulfatase-like hydrolase/transferase [Halobacteriales archaeon]